MAVIVPKGGILRMMGQRVNPQVLERAQEEEKIRGLLFRTEPTGNVGPHPEMSIVDLEGKPFMSGMSDRSAAARQVTRVNDTELNMPVELTGGQGFMFNNPLFGRMHKKKRRRWMLLQMS